MRHVRSIRFVVLTVAAVIATAAAAASIATATAPPKTITAAKIAVRPGTLKPGTSVSARAVGQRVFPNATHGFALATVGQADYPVATADGGKTWRTNGPALHIHAAQAPLAVVFPGAANAHTFYAFGGGQVVDATGDGGKHWWSALLGDAVVAVVPRLSGGLVAFVQNAGAGSSVATVVYVSTDGGHHWRRTTTFAT